jgi:CRISPR-associated protein Cas2
MGYDRFNAYRVMWVVVFFDMPTETKKDRKAYTVFRKHILKCGFTMFQYSIYVRHSLSKEYAEKYKRAVRRELPVKGHIVIAMMTDKQFGDMEVFHGEKKAVSPPTSKQLELF